MRHRLSNATTENLPNYWESDDEMAISFDDEVHFDAKDFDQESQFDFDDDQWTQSLDIPIDEQDCDEGGFDETESFVADGGLDDLAEDIVAFEQQNLHLTSDNAFHIDIEETGERRIVKSRFWFSKATMSSAKSSRPPSATKDSVSSRPPSSESCSSIGISSDWVH